MPIKIEKYRAYSTDIYTMEKTVGRFIARCTTKTRAKQIAKLLNDELKKKREAKV